MPTTDDPGLIAGALAPQTATPLGDIADQKFDESEKAGIKEEVKENEQDPAKAGDEKAQEGKEEPGADDDEGYFADEGLEDEEVAALEAVTDMGKWVLDQLPAINVSGLDGDKPINLQVKRAEDLPKNFSFASEYDRLVFNQNLSDQTNRAYRLVENYQNQQQQAEATRFSEQEDRDIQADIASLQREGTLGKFKYPVTDSRFNDDPAVKQMQAVLDFYNSENQSRWQDSQRSGRLFNRLGYRDAFRLWQLDNQTETLRQKAEDNARKTATRVTARAGNGTTPSQSRPQLRRDADISEIIAAYGVE